jgi:pimeloyl-ACP methyl ester carboxylesterase
VEPVAALEKIAVGDGIQVAYRSEGSGPPLVLIHGITEDHRAWDELVRELARDCRVIRLDLPGHGESSPLAEYNAQALVTPVAALMQALELDRPRLIGHSLGGLMVTLLGALVPARSIVNIDQPLRLGTFIERVRQIAPGLAGPDFVPTLNAEMEALGGPRLPARVRDELRKYWIEARRPVVCGLWLALVDADEQSLTDSFAPLLKQVRAPYLSLHGSDPGPRYDAWLKALIPSAVVETWPGLGHWLHRVEPARFLARVREFHSAS